MAEVKKDCFGWMPNSNRCGVLIDTYCKKEECRFYKTAKQYQEDLKKAEGKR